ncbi:MAG: SDR family NAD(P)-dependent oxidoreductase [Streptosporangiales bacterium]|nr:SDR family NAD(P)-dependent oxidoreductase [Streptosporangiales bacterium]
MQHAYRSALVTGASSGIGTAFARALARRGTDLVLVARNTDRLEELADDLRATAKVGVEVVAADLADRERLAALEERLADPARQVELLVNNAGLGTQGRFAELPLDGEQAQLDVNVTALVRLTRAALPGMIDRRHGGVLNVSSMAGENAAPGTATYAATKAFVTRFTEGVHAEVAGQNVHVTAVLPGLTRTDFHRRAGMRRDGLPGFVWTTPEEVATAGLDAVAAGRAICVPGLANKASLPLNRLLPRALVRSAMGRILGD